MSDDSTRLGSDDELLARLMATPWSGLAGLVDSFWFDASQRLLTRINSDGSLTYAQRCAILESAVPQLRTEIDRLLRDGWITVHAAMVRAQ